MTAKILHHPDRGSYKRVWKFDEVRITITKSNKRPLMLSETISALETVKFDLLYDSRFM